MAVGPGKAIIAHLHANGTLHTYIALNKPEVWIDAVDFNHPAVALQQVADEFIGWAAASHVGDRKRYHAGCAADLFLAD